MLDQTREQRFLIKMKVWFVYIDKKFNHTLEIYCLTVNCVYKIDLWTYKYFKFLNIFYSLFLFLKSIIHLFVKSSIWNLFLYYTLMRDFYILLWNVNFILNVYFIFIPTHNYNRNKNLVYIKSFLKSLYFLSLFTV